MTTSVVNPEIDQDFVEFFKEFFFVPENEKIVIPSDRVEDPNDPEYYKQDDREPNY